MAVVLVDKGYLTTFNTPRYPRVHTLRRVRIPGVLGRLWRPLQNVAVWNPLERHDLLHTFNRIPLASSTPWIVSYESFLPRTAGRGHTIVRDILREKLLSRQCRKIIAISDYAVRRNEQFLAGWDGLPDVLRKTEVIHPNIEVKDAQREYAGGPLSVVFIGNEFARKGGIVTLRMAEEAKRKRLPIHFHIVSSMVYGRGIYTDYQDNSAYDADLEALTLDNVTLYHSLPNAEVMSLIERCHFLLLPTLHDTYGFSPLEGMSRGVPAIATDTAAIPEFVKDAENGFLLSLPNDLVGDWAPLRKPPLEWKVVDEAYTSLATQALGKLENVLGSPEQWNRLSRGAISHIRKQHSAEKIGAQLEALYSESLRP